MKILKTTEFKIFLSIAVFFFLFAGWVGWNESSRIALSKSLVREGSFEINNYSEMTGDRALHDGDYYSDKMPGISIFSTPIFLIGDLFMDEDFESKEIIIDEEAGLSYRKEFVTSTNLAIFLATFLLSGMLTVATGYLLYLFSGEFIKNKRIRYLIPIIYCLGTIALSNGLYLQGHAAVAFFSFASFYLFFYRKNKFQDFGWSILSGILIGIAFLVDVLAIFVLIPLFVVYLLSKEYKNLLCYCGGFLLIFSLLLGYNSINFDGPLDFGYLNVDLESPQFSEDNIDLTYYNEKMGEEITFDNLDEELSNPQTTFNLLFHPSFSRYRAAIMARSLFSPERGLLIFSPILLLSFIGFFVLWKRNKELFFISLFVFLSVLWFRSTPYIKWWGGASFGLRHFMVAMPFLMIPLIVIVEKVNKKFLYFLVVLSVLISLFGGLQTPADLDSNLTLIDQNYLEEVKSFNALESPLAEIYLENFKKNGFESPLIQNSLIGNYFDIRSFSTEKRSSTSVAKTPFGFLVVDFKYFSILLPLFILFVIWFKYLGLRSKITSIIFLTGLVYLSFNIQNITYGDGWYKGEDFFMGKKGVIQINSTEREQFFRLKTEPHFDVGEADIYLNGEKVYNLNLTKEQDFLGLLDFNKGQNEIILKADNCTRPDQHLNNNDHRCLSLKLRSFKLFDSLNEKDINKFIDSGKSLFYEGFYAVEEINKTNGRWMSDQSKLKIPEAGVGKNIAINLLPYKENRELKIISESDKETVFVPKQGGGVVISPQNEIVKIESSCDIPSEIEKGSDDNRCLSFFIYDIKLTP